MKRAVNLAFGVACLLIGVWIGGWLAYNLLVEMQPAAEGKRMWPGLIFAGGAIYAGITRIRKAMRPSEPQEPA